MGRGEGDKTGGAIGSILSSLTGGLITSADDVGKAAKLISEEVIQFI